MQGASHESRLHPSEWERKKKVLTVMFFRSYDSYDDNTSNMV